MLESSGVEKGGSGDEEWGLGTGCAAHYLHQHFPLPVYS